MSKMRWSLGLCSLLGLSLTSGIADAKPYKGAELYSKAAVTYGRMEMRMRVARGSGLLSTFFLYKDGSEQAGAFWEEVDIEVFGKDDAKSWQSNIIVGQPRTLSEEVHTETASLADAYHTFTLEWAPNSVRWLIDGVEVRLTEGGQAAQLTNPESLRFNIWAAFAEGWVGPFDDAVLPQYQFVNWIKYYRYEDGQFVLDWTDDFDALDEARWGTANWTFAENRVDFAPENIVVKDGTLVLALTKEGETGFTGTVPEDTGAPPAGTGGTGSGSGGSLGAGGAEEPGSGTGSSPALAGSSGMPGETTPEGCGCRVGPTGNLPTSTGLLASATLAAFLLRRRRNRTA
jgi:endo-1,3-1,4-beta-glycanase ExoK